MAKKKIKKTKKTETAEPPKVTDDGIQILQDRFIKGNLERTASIEHEKQIAVFEQQIHSLSELLKKRDKEIMGLRDENDKLRNAQHYGHFN